MKKIARINKKLWAGAVALLLVAALTATALAAWPSFQNDTNNNGQIPTSPAAPISTPTVTTIALPTNNPRSDVYSGIDAETITNGNIAYTLYNSGDAPVTSTSGGARIYAIDLSSKNPLWSPAPAVELFDSNASSPVDYHADNVSQLSTPYYDTANNVIYAAKTYYSDIAPWGSLTEWVDSSGKPLPSTYTFNAGTNTIYYTVKPGIDIPADFWVPQVVTDISSDKAKISGNVVLTGASTTINFGPSTYYNSGNFVLYNNNGSIVPSGQYTIALSITTDMSVDISSVKFLVSGWAVYKLTNVTAATPAVTRIETGWGQANTPIKFDSSGRIYWGIYEGSRSYYQYDTAVGKLKVFTPGVGGRSDDFYGPGVVIATVGNADYAVFGGDRGNTYVRDVGNFDTRGTQFPLYGVGVGDRIRSSVTLDNSRGYAYFTSYNSANASGNLWQVLISDLASSQPASLKSTKLTNASTSTPVVSPTTDYIYVGTYRGFSEGTVEAYPYNNFIDTAKQQLYPQPGRTGLPVQSSVMVMSFGYPLTRDYVYFTTNASNGGGNAAALFQTSTQVSTTDLWSAGGTGANNYALQGFSWEDIGSTAYIVYGDDSNNLYIMQ
ncbi:MAG: hypothetical protein LBD85_03310 [Oscillospiraceae bacterium]|jgi:hypothetical protein|nr:hypothetical protein [Oscillospiraceae bacterium]